MSAIEGNLKKGSFESDAETQDTKAWLDLMQVMSAPGSNYPPVTALLAAMHNIVSAGVSDKYITEVRRGYYCPEIVAQKLKAGIFSTDAEVYNAQPGVFTSISLEMQSMAAKIPGLASQHRLVNCTVA